METFVEDGFRSTVLELKGIKRGYRPKPEHSKTELVLTGIDLVLSSGTLVAIMGPSGSGKTTLLRIAGLLDLPDEGTVWLKGHDVTGLGGAKRRVLLRTQIGFIFQSGNLLDLLTARENVELAVEGLGLVARERKARTEEALSRMGLEALGDRFPHQLSVGEQQRVAVARALARKPSVVICDEPTAHLDERNAVGLAHELVTLARSGTACLLATHDASVAALADQVQRMASGKLTSNQA